MTADEIDAEITAYRVEAIVSGDAHLLGIGEFRGIHHACGRRESAGRVTGTSDVARSHFRASGTTISRGDVA